MKATNLEACNMASALLKGAGFKLEYVSRKSEACYFSFPGRMGWLRLAAHTQRKARTSGLTNPVMSKLTLSDTHQRHPGFVIMSDEKFSNTVAAAIGHYFLRAPTSDEIACNLPFRRVPVCACDDGQQQPPTRQQTLECKLRGGPCSPNYISKPRAPSREAELREALEPLTLPRLFHTWKDGALNTEECLKAAMDEIGRLRKGIADALSGSAPVQPLDGAGER